VNVREEIMRKTSTAPIISILLVLALIYIGCDIKRHPDEEPIVSGVHAAIAEMNSVTDLSGSVPDSTQGFLFFGGGANEYYPDEGECFYTDEAAIGFLLSEGPGNVGPWVIMFADPFNFFAFEHTLQSNGLEYYSLMDEETEFLYDTFYHMFVMGGPDMYRRLYRNAFRTPQEINFSEPADPSDIIEVYQSTTNGLTISWNPASSTSDFFTIEAAIYRQENVIGRVFCSAKDTDGTFTIPADLLRELPTTYNDSIEGRLIVKRINENIIPFDKKGFMLSVARVDMEMALDVFE